MSDNIKSLSHKPKRKSNKIAIISALVLVLAAASFFTYSYITKSFFFDDKAEDEPVIDQVYALDEFVLNLKDSNSRRYLKTKIALGYENKKDVEILAENNFQIRDVIIQTLRMKNAEEIMAAEKTEDLKRELMDDINGLFEPDLVLDIYIIDFLVQ